MSTHSAPSSHAPAPPSTAVIAASVSSVTPAGMPKLRSLGLTLDSPATQELSPMAPTVPRSTGGKVGLARKGSFTKGKAREAAGLVLSETHATPSCVIYGDEAHPPPSAGAATAASHTAVGAGRGAVYVGSAHAFWNTDWLVDHDIGFILNCAGSLERNFGARHTSAVERAREAGMTVLTVPWKDTVFTELQPLLSHALQYVAAARASGRGVLVHCAAGRSRSVTVCVAYSMLLTKTAFTEAFAQVLQRHGDADPNPGFRDQLRELSGELTPGSGGFTPQHGEDEEWGATEVVDDGLDFSSPPVSGREEFTPSSRLAAQLAWCRMGIALGEIENKEAEAEAYPAPCKLLQPAPTSVRSPAETFRFDFGSPASAAAGAGR